MDPGSERVVQGSTSSRAEFFESHRPDAVQPNAVIENLAILIEKDDGDVDRARIFPLLLFDKLVEAVDRTLRVGLHRTAPIKN